jgi:predicted ArsR family transcriptional regulator
MNHSQTDMLTGSKKELITLIKQRGLLSIDDAVVQTDLAKTTIREHFLQLEKDGYIKRGYVRSGPGRPSLQYSITKEGDRLFPSSESDLIRELLRFLKENDSKETIHNFFASFWEKRLQTARKLMNETSDKSQEARLSALMEFLEGEGFMPKYSVNSEENSLFVKECNCPFSEVIKETRLPCKLEAEFYEKLFDCNVERSSYIADGDYSCTYKIILPE